ncbi:family 43 glycosylhydrolase [Olivibacter ginsenosidimutans]|uniref:Family 43 glycosylhydrolase n=1 Tax=Olivibacter ginsenosidimutans TaxID=1176537 RepID=A0ABP9AIT6_9SPHI
MLINMYASLMVLLLLFSDCSKQQKNPDTEKKEEKKQTFDNPLVRVALADPTVIHADDGWFYVYATAGNVPIWKSKDLVDWRQAGNAFTDDTRPHFVEDGAVWAPEINYIDGKYVLYYAMSTWGGEWKAGIGVAVSDSPLGPFQDLGKMFDSQSIGVKNSIDQAYMEDGGKKYLIWGSFNGIYIIELSDDGLSIKPGAAKKQLVGSAYEGSYVYKKGKYYYYFGSTGTCCEGAKSTYHVVYGRSESLFGPYVNKRGESLLDNHFETLIDNNSRFVGNGHNSQIVQDDAGNDWMLYHGFELASSPGQWDRFLMMSQIKWDEEGWPYVEGGSPQMGAPKPVFEK